MREILFRGKRLDNGEWFYGFPFISTSGKLVEMKQMNSYEYRVEPETVGQYTGIIDKNGVRIFEGDIVRATSQLTGKSDRYCLVFDTTRLHFGFRVARHGYFYNIVELLEEELGDEIDFELIGNIYDNPELLEVAE